MRTALACLLALALSSPRPAPACGSYLDDPTLETAVAAALAGDAQALVWLANLGRPAWQAVQAAYAADAADGVVDDAAWDPLFTASAHALGARANGLYWHTDLDTAREESRKTGKPILMLRLLGRLDQDLSCANSRFFRAILYSDPAIIAAMNSEVILCWTSERPVPHLRIDFGDGRVVQTTITGNSAHYLLDDQGRVRDVMPGLVAPTAFRTWLQAAVAKASPVAQATGPAPGLRSEIARLVDERREALTAAEIPDDLIDTVEARVAMPALDAGALAMSKRAVEVPVLRAAARETRGNEHWAVWVPVADHLAVDTTLAPEALALLRTQLDDDFEGEALDTFDRDLRIDTVRNLYRLRPQALAMLADEPLPAFDAFNARIYDEVFLTPASDAWLGLDPRAMVTGLDRGGLN